MLQIQDHIQEVIRRYHSSFYFYDLDGFEAHIKSIKKTLHPDISVWYATKANPMSEILRILKENGFGMDVASLGELQQVRSVKPFTNKIIATGPAKTRHYLGALMEAQVETVVVESINQLKDLNEICGRLRKKQDVLLRVQLDWENELKSVLGGSAITPFGLGLDDWKAVDISAFNNINVLGVHCFQWGNILDIEELEKVWRATIEASRKFSLEMNFDLEVLDLGGGLGLSYTDDRELNFSDVHDLLLKLKSQYELKKIWLELGRFSIGKFGSYLTPIIDIKTVKGKNIIITEGGINHMARPALVGEAFPCEAFMIEDSEMKRFSVHGPLCTALDKLGDFDLPATLKPGDWLQFHRTGAYGFSESMPYFLCHELAGEAMISKGELLVPRVPRAHLEWTV